MKKYFVIIILAALSTLLFASCSGSSAQVSESAIISVPSESTQISSDSVSTGGSEVDSIKTASLSDETQTKIRDYLKQRYTGTDIKVLKYYDVGFDYILVNFDLVISTNRFVLYNSKTGTYESLPVQDADLLKVINENYFVFENRGDYSDSVLKSAPHIEYCFRISNKNGDDNFRTLYKNEIFDITRPILTGGKDNQLLSHIIITADGIEMVYEPASDNDMLFYADVTYIPTTSTSYNSETKQFTIEISTNQVSNKIKNKVSYSTEDNFYISSYQIIAKNNKTLIVLTLRDSAGGYTVDFNRSADANEFPYLTLSFGQSTDNQFDN